MERALTSRGASLAAYAAIVLVGLVIRATGTDERTLFWDEGYHLRLAMLPSLDGMLAAILANPPSDPLYALFLRGWVSLVGTADPLIRLPSVVAGALTSLAAAWLAWELTQQRRVALVSALLVAISPYLVEFGQEASLYVFATFLVTLALACGWRWRRMGERTSGVVAVVLAAIALYSHYVAAPILGLFALISATPFAGSRRISIRQIAVAAAVALLLWAPWLVPMATSWATMQYPRTALHHAATAGELFSGLRVLTSGGGTLLQGIYPIQALALLGAGVLLLRAWLVARDPAYAGLRVVLVVSAVLFVGPWVVSAVTGRWLFIPHLMLPLLPALGVVIAAGALLDRRPGSRWDLAAAIALVCFVVAQVGGLVIHANYPPHGRYGIDEIVAIIEAEGSSEDPILVMPLEHQIVLDPYLPRPSYGLPQDIDLSRLYEPYDPLPVLSASMARFIDLTKDADRAWLLYSPERDEGGRLLAWLDQIGTVSHKADTRLVDLYLITLP